MKNIWSGSIPVDNIDTMSERVNKVAKRAAKVGFPAPTLTLGKQWDQPQYEPDTESGELRITHYVKMVDVSIDAPDTLRLSGWEFIATVTGIEQQDKTIAPFLTYVPGAERVELPFTVVNWCDHCKTARQRTNTYVVMHPEQGVKQVGSTCLKDFLGHNPSEIVGYLDAIYSLPVGEDEIDGWRGSSIRFYDPAEVLDYAARVVVKAGYISKAKAEEEYKTSTGELVREFLTSRGNAYNNLAGEYPDSEQSSELVVATIAAIGESKAYDGWEADVVTLAKAKGIQWRHVGIVASAVILGLRKQERKAQAAAKGESNFIGQPGERITIKVKVTMKREFEGQFGPTYVIRMLANESDDLLWFASWSDKTMAINEGDEFTITGTIKKHELDKRSERPTTVLTRCKF